MYSIKNKWRRSSVLRSLLWISAVTSVMSACRTKDPEPGNSITADVRDSVYYYAKELYLWTSQLPDRNTFNPLSYSDGEAVIKKVQTFSPLNGKGQHDDRFSFVMPKADWDNLSAGTESDFGVGFKFASANDLRIAYVYAQSSAGKQGVARGWRVLSINGTEANTNNVDALNTALGQNAVNMVFEKPDGTQQTLTLRTDAYQTNPVLKSKVLMAGSQKVGYVLFNTFLGNTAVQDLQTAFNDFKSQGIDELVVDLRYNGGGSTDILESFANLLAPNNAAGRVMYKMQWNDQYAPQLNKTISFSNSPSGLNLSRILFITTHSTASASELLINSLSPYVNVTLIGDTTVGKPVGFPVIPIEMSKTDPSHNVVVAAVAFKNVNANDFGDYFEGLPVNKVVVDDLTKDFGDPSEACLSKALSYFETGNLRIGMESPSARVGAVSDPAVRKANQELDHGRKGLYYQMR